jgi:hypothetical protein
VPFCPTSANQGLAAARPAATVAFLDDFPAPMSPVFTLGPRLDFRCSAMGFAASRQVFCHEIVARKSYCQLSLKC